MNSTRSEIYVRWFYSGSSSRLCNNLCMHELHMYEKAVRRSSFVAGIGLYLSRLFFSCRMQHETKQIFRVWEPGVETVAAECGYKWIRPSCKSAKAARNRKLFFEMTFTDIQEHSFQDRPFISFFASMPKAVEKHFGINRRIKCAGKMTKSSSGMAQGYRFTSILFHCFICKAMRFKQ